MANNNKNKMKKRSTKKSNYYDKSKNKSAKSAEKEVNDQYCGPKMNDPKWYYTSETMLNNAASLAFNDAAGLNIQWKTAGSPTWGNIGNSAEMVPGIMAFDTVLTPGIASMYNDAVNISAQNILSDIRLHKSGPVPYDRADVMLTLMAMDTAFAMWNHAKRAYCIARTYSTVNRYYPTALLTAMGFDANDIIHNLADFRANLNRMAAQLQSVAVPSKFSIFVRHSWMYSNIFKDSSSDKAQMYLFRPATYYVYDPKTSTQGGQLVATPFPVTATTGPDGNYLQTASSYTTVLDDILEAILSDDDIARISGDIRNAYGDGSLFRLSFIADDEQLIPEYSEEVLSQIHNASVGYISRTAITDKSHGWSIAQNVDSNILTFKPNFVTNLETTHQISFLGYAYPRMLNMRFDNPTPEDVIVATRLQFITGDFNPAGTGLQEFPILHAGTEILTKAYVYTYSWVENLSEQVLLAYEWQQYVNAQTPNVMTMLQHASNFDWCPLIYSTAPTYVENQGLTLTGFYGDVNNYTLLGIKELYNLHQCALFGEFGIPNTK